MRPAGLPANCLAGAWRETAREKERLAVAYFHFRFYKMVAAGNARLWKPAARVFPLFAFLCLAAFANHYGFFPFLFAFTRFGFVFMREFKIQILCRHGITSLYFYIQKRRAASFQCMKARWTWFAVRAATSKKPAANNVGDRLFRCVMC